MTTHDEERYPCSLSKEELAGVSRKTQVRAMRRWFRQRFQDPIEECPYDSEVGGYQFIYGGPYEAGDQLYAEFGQFVPEVVIEKLVQKLEEECTEWSGVPKPEDFDVDDFYSDTPVSTADPLDDLQASLTQLEEMLTLPMSPESSDRLMKMAFINVITTMETYLSEVFIKEVSGDQTKLRILVETDPFFAKQKIPLSRVFENSEKILETAKAYLAKLMWHNVGKIKPMFKSVLGVELPDVLAALGPAVGRRHDLVHRGGKTKDGKTVVVQAADVAQVIVVVRQLADGIRTSLVEKVSLGSSDFF